VRCGKPLQREPPTRPAGTGELTRADVDAWLDGIVPSALEREGIAGATVSVVHDGQVLTERGFGFADTGAGGTPATVVDPSTTLFRIGSISKLVTATAVMQLVAAGRLDLDAPVADTLDFELPTRFAEPVTLRHLLTHTAGSEDRIAGVILPAGGSPPTLRDEVSLDPPEQIYAPGTTPSYSNHSNALAAYLVERVTAEPYSRYVQHEVLDRAGMAMATLDQPLPARLRAQMSKGYESSRSQEVPFEVVGPAPAVALSASAADMSSFMLAQLDTDGSTTSRLLDAQTLTRMQQPALGADSLGGLAAGPRMALGFFEQDRNGHRILGHGGDLTAFHAQLQLYPDDDTGVFVAVNSVGTRPDSTTALRDQICTASRTATTRTPDRRRGLCRPPRSTDPRPPAPISSRGAARTRSPACSGRSRGSTWSPPATAVSPSRR